LLPASIIACHAGRTLIASAWPSQNSAFEYLL